MNVGSRFGLVPRQSTRVYAYRVRGAYGDDGDGLSVLVVSRFNVERDLESLSILLVLDGLKSSSKSRHVPIVLFIDSSIPSFATHHKSDL